MCGGWFSRKRIGFLGVWTRKGNLLEVLWIMFCGEIFGKNLQMYILLIGISYWYLEDFPKAHYSVMPRLGSLATKQNTLQTKTYPKVTWQFSAHFLFSVLRKHKKHNDTLQDSYLKKFNKGLFYILCVRFCQKVFFACTIVVVLFLYCWKLCWKAKNMKMLENREFFFSFGIAMSKKWSEIFEAFIYDSSIDSLKCKLKGFIRIAIPSVFLLQYTVQIFVQIISLAPNLWR